MILKPPEDIQILDVPKAVPFDARREAMRLYFKGYDCEQIAAELNINANTVRSWKTRDDWDNTPYMKRVEDCLFTKINRLIDAPVLTPTIKADVDFLVRQIKNLAQVRRYVEKDGHAGDLNENIAKRNEGPKKEPKLNYINEENKQKLIEAFQKTIFEYQREWFDVKHFRNRFILKSRQIGATFYFALEALLHAMETGNNQIFISASEKQAKKFRNFIVKFVRKHTGISLRGNPLILNVEGIEEMPEFHFLATNSSTAQSYDGDVYIDECFWIYDFLTLKNVAGGMATLSRYRRTYFSTPSSISHDAYKFWTGADYNKGRPKEKQVTIDLQADGIKNGTLYSDQVWRQVVTIHDAIAKGNNLIDLDQIRDENSVEAFENLYECKFVDDSQSCFPLYLIQPCMVDTFEKWKINPYSLNQKHLGKAILACDPSRVALGDPAGITVTLAPKRAGEKNKVLFKKKYKGLGYEKLAAEIASLMQIYDIAEIVIDETGEGHNLLEKVQKFFPNAKGVRFSVITKGNMVRQAQFIFRSRLIEFDISWSDLAADLMSIHPQLTGSQREITYTSRRSSNGHGEYGWCILLTLSLADVDGNFNQNNSNSEFI